MLFKNGELKLLWPHYLKALILGSSFVVLPYFVLYFIKSGYSYLQISILQFSFGVATFLFEIPTGAVADSWGRKSSVIMGLFLISVSVFLVPLMPNFILLICMFIFYGLGTTFISGAEEALVIDNLNKLDRRDLHHDYFIKMTGFASFGLIFGSVFGATLVKYFSLSILWFVFGLGYFASAIVIILFAKEHFSFSKPNVMHLVNKSYRNSKRALHFTLNNKTFLVAIFAGIFMELIFAGCLAMPTYLVSLGMPEYQLGYTVSIMAIVGIGTSFLSKIFSKYKFKNVLSATIAIHIVLLVSLLFIYPPFFYLTAFVFILIDGLREFAIPLTQTFFHQFDFGRIRATVMSTKSMITTFTYGLSMLVTGHLLDLFGIQKVLACGSVFGIVAIVLYQKINK